MPACRSTIFEQWQGFRKSAVPCGASPAQIEETRRAFYGGCASTLHEMIVSIAALPDDEAAEAFLIVESEAFASEVSGSTATTGDMT